MELKTSIVDYTRYNHWANEVLTDWLKSQDLKLFQLEVKSSFPSIALTLQHMKNAQNFWHAVISHKSVDSPTEELRLESIDWLIGELLTSSQKLIDLVVALDDTELSTMVSPPALPKTKFESFFHVVNHNSYHRGQIVTMVRSLGVSENIPGTDYDNYLWVKANGQIT